MRSLVLAFATAAAQDTFLARASQASDPRSERLVWKNPPLPEGATDPNADAIYIYDGRNQAYDLELDVFDENQRSMLEGPEGPKVEKFLRKVVKDIFAWNSTEWAAALDRLGPDSVFDKEDVLSKRGSLYWEIIAQLVVERVLGPETWMHEPVLLLGPDCMTAHGQVERCRTRGLGRASVVNVSLSIDGPRNAVEIFTHRVNLVAQRDTTNSSNFDVTVRTGIVVPHHTLGSQYREQLDLRPFVGDGDSRISAEIVATSHGVGNYPDYNPVFIPLRHLVLQGEVEDPKLPQSSMRYPDVETFQKAAAALIEEMRAEPTTESARARTYPFITDFADKYYYMWEAVPLSWWNYSIGLGWQASGYADVVMTVDSS